MQVRGVNVKRDDILAVIVDAMGNDAGFYCVSNRVRLVISDYGTRK